MPLSKLHSGVDDLWAERGDTPIAGLRCWTGVDAFWNFVIGPAGEALGLFPRHSQPTHTTPHP